MRVDVSRCSRLEAIEIKTKKVEKENKSILYNIVYY